MFGASGFVGGSVSDALKERGHEAIAIGTPRLSWCPGVGDAFIDARSSTYEELVQRVRAAKPHVVVNAAGAPDATSDDYASLFGANAAIPAFLARAAKEAGVKRFVHVSSAAVQGRVRVLDSTPRTAPASPYAESKALGERLVQKFGPSETVVYRPAGVHGANRLVTQKVARYAESRLALVAARDRPTPQSLIQNVGDAIAFLATVDADLPPIVHHPAEGVSVASLLEQLGGRSPVSCRALFLVLPLLRSVHGRFAGHARRLEMLWFGQEQAASWLDAEGWTPPVGPEGWIGLGQILRSQ